MPFKAGYEEAQKRGSKSSGRSFAALGLDPRRWLKNARNAGESKVGDTETIKITGDVDVPALLDDVEVALRKARVARPGGRGEAARPGSRRSSAGRSSRR